MAIDYIIVWLLYILFKVGMAFPIDEINAPGKATEPIRQDSDSRAEISSAVLKQADEDLDFSETDSAVNARDRRQLFGDFGLGRPSGPSGGSSQADAQAQAFNVNGPLGSFGASATGAQTQSLGFGPGGLSAAAGFSGAQQYRLPNGQVIDVTFANTFSGANGNPARASSSGVTVTNSDGSVQNL